jgi:hypothetical protein
MKFLSWDEHNKQICDRIISSPTPVKVILKTRNESMFLKEWIAHHERIFGRKSLIVFDNMSDSLATNAVYSELSDMIEIFKFGGMHNLIHDRGVFKELYHAIKSSCDYYIFLDTDELLYWYTGEEREIFAGPEILRAIVNSNDLAIPGIWIETTSTSSKELLFTFQQARISSGLRGGKPMISSTAPIVRFGNHNIQCDPSVLSAYRTANLIIVHLKNISAEQRIKVNLEKLQSYNSVKGELSKFGIPTGKLSLTDVLQANHEKMPDGNARNYVIEVKRLSITGPGSLVNDCPNFARLDGSKLLFTNEEEGMKIDLFIRNPRAEFSRVFSPV